MKKLKAVALIPARGGSKGIPLKALHKLFRYPLMEFAARTALNSKFSEVWCSTEDIRIKNFALSLGMNVIDRPIELAGGKSSIEDVILHFTEHVNYDILCLIQATSPLILPQHIIKGMNMFVENIDKYDSAFSTYSMEKNDILFWDKETMKPVNYDYLNRGVRQERKDKYHVETGGFYITTREQFLESKCRIGKKPMFIEIPFWASMEVDTMEDLKNIEKLVAY